MRNWIEGLPALLAALSMGSGIVSYAWRGKRPMSIPELVAWGWLAGSAVISLLVAAAGLFWSAPPPVVVMGLAALSAGSGFFALHIGRKRGLAWFPTEGELWEKWISLVPLAGVIWAFALTFSSPLLWDGLLIWEFKARIAFFHDGHFPPELFSDPTRVNLHPGYPLYIPASELWIYLCSAHYDQTTVKVLFPPFYLAAALLLWSGAARVTGRLWAGSIAALLPIFIPQLCPSSGPLLDGYADFPLAVFYLAAVSALLLPRDEEEAPGQWILAMGAAGVLPWIKQEGLLLWLSFALVSCVRLLPRHWRLVVWTILPGAMVMAAWKLTLRTLHIPAENIFDPINATTIPHALERVGVVGNYFLHELSDTDTWSLLWILTVPAFVCLLLPRAKGGALVVAILFPLALDFVPYLFTRLELGWHLQMSCTRVVLQTAIVAVFAIGVALVPRPEEQKSEEPAVPVETAEPVEPATPSAPPPVSEEQPIPAPVRKKRGNKPRKIPEDDTDRLL